VREFDLPRLALGLHLGPLETHPRADEGRDEFIVLIAVLLTQVVLDAAASEVAGVDGAIETVEKHAGRDAVAETDRLMELDVRLGVEATETAPADLHRPETSENEARRRDDPAERSRSGVLLVRPQRVVIADALAESQDRHPVREFVVDRHGGTQLGADESPHLREHLVGEFARGQFLAEPRFLRGLRCRHRTSSGDRY